jgi:hypothetical protein
MKGLRARSDLASRGGLWISLQEVACTDIQRPSAFAPSLLLSRCRDRLVGEGIALGMYGSFRKPSGAGCRGVRHVGML